MNHYNNGYIVLAISVEYSEVDYSIIQETHKSFGPFSCEVEAKEWMCDNFTGDFSCMTVMQVIPQVEFGQEEYIPTKVVDNVYYPDFGAGK